VLKKIVAVAFCLTFLAPCAALAGQVRALKVTVLSTMLADRGFGEWGYAALVEVDGRKILFDTGANPDTVLKNAKALHIDLSDVEDVVISHNHGDHTGGLVALRRELMKTNPHAMSRAHVSANVFLPRLRANGSDVNGLTPLRAEYERLGGQFVLHEGPAELAPGVWFTGPVPRKYPETNWSTGDLRIHTAAGDVVDNVPDDAALVFSTPEGLVVLTGCGHAGIVNISEYAQQIAGPAPVFAVIGGLHLFAKGDDVVDWTAAQLRRLGVKYLLAGHCTGIEATWRLRTVLGLTRRTAPVSSVGSSFTLGKGIDPGELAA
jgi:7,8-dihydropterin-6-yl-methyl-4-(beta-D-ribofuranosyl)aminobenzene 5'-phosphate synthase